MKQVLSDQMLDVVRTLLSANDANAVCDRIIDEAQALTGAEGGTLYLTEGAPPKKLIFHIVHNRTLGVFFQGFKQPLPMVPISLFDDDDCEVPNLHHIAAYAANNRKLVNVADAYDTKSQVDGIRFDFSGAKHFDEDNNYHTESVLAVPLVNQRGHLLGVLQLINAHHKQSKQVTEFPPEIEADVQTLAQFAAIALDAQYQTQGQTDLLVELAAQPSSQALLEKVLDEAQKIAFADGGTLYLYKESDDGEQQELEFAVLRNDSLHLNLGGLTGEPIPFPPLPLYNDDGPNEKNVATFCGLHLQQINIEDAYETDEFDFSGTRKFDKQTGYRSKSFLTLPMLNHNKELIGVMQLVNARDPETLEVIPFSEDLVPLISALATYAAVALNNRILVKEIKNLLDAFIMTIAKAIDAKSPHTSGHCQRVPILTELIAEAACDDDQVFNKFDLDADGWYELKVAAWLHDCGKLATPDSVLNKSTKLNMLLDGIDSVRPRFVALEHQLTSNCWQKIADNPEDKPRLLQKLDIEIASLREDLEFLQVSNKGGEFMDPEAQERVKAIAKRTWQDVDGVDKSILSEEEVYNLCISRGTLNNEERDIINNHMQVTIDMLDGLPFPKKLRKVPEYAGGHHEKMDGSGFPNGLTRDQLSLPARMMAIADIFEALTAKDRPYKDPMKISQALSILKNMKQANHIDPDLYNLFVSAKVWEKYAQQVLTPDQLDVKDPKTYL